MQDYGEKNYMRSLAWCKRRIIEHGSHMMVWSGAMKYVFLKGGRIVSYKIVYVMFIIVDIIINQMLKQNF